MSTNNLPTKIAVFPLSGVIFFPKTVLPLNIFEKRYIQMIDDCMKDKKLLGMIQPKFKTSSNPEVYNVGCLGKITNFNETADKRFIINLQGISRFKVKEELKTDKLYRKFEVDYSDFNCDLIERKKKFDNKNLINKIKTLFKKNDYSVEVDKLGDVSIDQLVNTICMIFPFSIAEKQKLIETIEIDDKIKVLEEIINFNLVGDFENRTVQ